MPSITIPLRLKSVFSSSRRSRKGSPSPPVSILSTSTPVLPLSSSPDELSFSPVESVSSTMVHFSPDVASTPSSSNSSPTASPRVESRRAPPQVERASKPVKVKAPYRSRSQMLPTRTHSQNAFEYIRIPTLPGYFF